MFSRHATCAARCRRYARRRFRFPYHHTMRWPNERVLVIPRPLFDSLGAFEGLTTDVDRYLPAFLDPANNHFLARDDAEEDPGHKQIIPYALFHCRGRFLHQLPERRTRTIQHLRRIEPVRARQLLMQLNHVLRRCPLR